jgi:transcriptional regulator with XRE-family HTH domain
MEVVLMSVRHRPGSKPYRDQLRASLSAMGAQGPRLTELVARDLLLHGTRPRQAWRYAAELSQREAAGRFNQLTGNPRAPMTGNRIGDYEQWPDGGVRPTVGTLKILAGAYGTTWDQLVDSRDLAHMPGGDRLEYLESSHVPARPPAEAARPHQPRTRRSRDDVIADVADESLEFGEWAGMSEVADATIGQYEQQVRRLAREFEFGAPLLPLLLETRRLRDHVTARLRGHTRLDQARDLYLLTAQVCGLLAWLTGDLGNYRAADTHAWTAWMCAEQAGHHGARAWVRATQAKLAYWDGRFTESARLAEDGLGYAPADSAGVFLALFQARALARTGQREAASRALTRSEAERSGASAPDLLGGIWGMEPVRYHGLAASTLLMLDAPARVLTETAEVIALSEAAPPGERHLFSWAQAHIDAAHAHLQQHDLDGAVTALRPVLDAPPDGRIDPVLQQLGRLRQTLALPAFAVAPLARSLQDEIETCRREALPRQITA